MRNRLRESGMSDENIASLFPTLSYGHKRRGRVHRDDERLVPAPLGPPGHELDHKMAINFTR